ncbi:MAG: L,D-transpeptidase [Bacteroidales bacterium]
MFIRKKTVLSNTKRSFRKSAFLVLTIGAFTTVNSATIKKDLTFTKYTLADTTYVGKKMHIIQWNKIDSVLNEVESFEDSNSKFGVLTNYKNIKGIAPIVENHSIDKYHEIQDAYGYERDQAIPLYNSADLKTAVRYAHDGTWVGIAKTENNASYCNIITPHGSWYIPDKYIKPIDATKFTKVIVIDRLNQNIVTLEEQDNTWYVRSINPATTGLDNPPYKKATPLGYFVLQAKEEKMVYNKDKGTGVAGYAPFANRFSGGAYIHGVPVELPATALIEYSPTLGTSPRSHMCVRNATSHAKFIYDWAPVDATIIVVID